MSMLENMDGMYTLWEENGFETEYGLLIRAMLVYNLMLWEENGSKTKFLVVIFCVL